MSINLNINENMDLMFQKLESFIKSKTVFGDPVTIGDTTLIPILKISFGMGVGGGDEQKEKGANEVGGGAGIGGKVTPCAVLSIHDGKTEVLPISRVSGLEKIMESIPDIVSKLKAQKSNDGQSKANIENN